MKLTNTAYIYARYNPQATISATHDGIEVRVQFSRRMELDAGQFVYTRFPGLSMSSILRSHPYHIAWVDNDEEGKQSLSILIKLRRGYTRKLLLADPTHKYQVIIEGPYGKSLQVDQFGTILLFASDVGIVAQLAIIRHCLHLYQSSKTKMKRIKLYWEIGAEGMLR